MMILPCCVSTDSRLLNSVMDASSRKLKEGLTSVCFGLGRWQRHLKQWRHWQIRKENRNGSLPESEASHQKINYDSPVDSSAPAIHRSWVLIPSTPSFAVSINSQNFYYIGNSIVKRTKINKKMPTMALNIFQKHPYQFGFLVRKISLLKRLLGVGGDDVVWRLGRRLRFRTATSARLAARRLGCRAGIRTGFWTEKKEFVYKVTHDYESLVPSRS